MSTPIFLLLSFVDQHYRDCLMRIRFIDNLDYINLQLFTDSIRFQSCLDGFFLARSLFFKFKNGSFKMFRSE